MLTPAPHIHHATGPHGTAVLDARHGNWLMLDPDGSRIWNAVLARGGTDHLADEIAARTGADPQHVADGIDAFVASLTARGVLIDPEHPHTTRRRCRR